jgi:hypothetical protein
MITGLYNEYDAIGDDDVDFCKDLAIHLEK